MRMSTARRWRRLAGACKEILKSWFHRRLFHLTSSADGKPSVFTPFHSTVQRCTFRSPHPTHNVPEPSRGVQRNSPAHAHFCASAATHYSTGPPTLAVAFPFWWLLFSTMKALTPSSSVANCISPPSEFKSKLHVTRCSSSDTAYACVAIQVSQPGEIPNILVRREVNPFAHPLLNSPSPRNFSAASSAQLGLLSRAYTSPVRFVCSRKIFFKESSVILAPNRAAPATPASCVANDPTSRSLGVITTSSVSLSSAGGDVRDLTPLEARSRPIPRLASAAAYIASRRVVTISWYHSPPPISSQIECSPRHSDETPP